MLYLNKSWMILKDLDSCLCNKTNFFSSQTSFELHWNCWLLFTWRKGSTVQSPFNVVRRKFIYWKWSSSSSRQKTYFSTISSRWWFIMSGQLSLCTAWVEDGGRWTEFLLMLRLLLGRDGIINKCVIWWWWWGGGGGGGGGRGQGSTPLSLELDVYY